MCNNCKRGAVWRVLVGDDQAGKPVVIPIGSYANGISTIAIIGPEDKARKILAQVLTQETGPLVVSVLFHSKDAGRQWRRHEMTPLSHPETPIVAVGDLDDLEEIEDYAALPEVIVYAQSDGTVQLDDRSGGHAAFSTI